MIVRTSFRTKLLGSYAALVFAVLAIVDLELNAELSSDLELQLDRRLEREAHDAAAWLHEGTPPERVAAHAAATAGARATIIAKDGRVLADSERPGDTLSGMENHARRPEVLDALAGAIGRSSRFSATLQVPMRYVAVPALDGGVVRLAVPLTEIESTLASMRLMLAGTSALALSVAILLGLLVSRIALAPLLEMTTAAGRLARGEFRITMPEAAEDEFGILSRALTRLATELEQRLGDLTGERDRLSSMLSGMVEGVLVIDRDGRVVVANVSAAQILDCDGELVGRTVAEAIRHPAAREAIASTIREGRPTEAEIDALGRDRRAVALNVQPLSSAAGGGVVAVLHDVTRLRRLETMRRDFVSNVSHELKTPLASIQSYAESLIDGALAEPDTARRFAEAIHRNAARMGRLVKDLLELSQLEAQGPEQRVHEVVSVAEIASEVAETTRLREHGVKIDTEVPDDLQAQGDPEGVARMLFNLVDNAVKYGGRSGRVRITGERDGSWIRLSVSDDGPGIEERHLSRIFERFYRVDAGRARHQGGTGLGLAIVKHLAESMGGGVEVASRPGQGTSFTVRLPSPRG